MAARPTRPYARRVTTERPGWPTNPAYSGRQDQIDQALAEAAARIERWFDRERPVPAELVKAKVALDRAVELLTTPSR